MTFWAELKRRNVVKVAAAYAIVGWLVIEVSSVLLPTFEAPDWILRVIVLLVGIGLVLAIFLSWAYELTPEGIKSEKDVDRSASITHLTGRKLDFLIIAALSVALLFVVIDQYFLEDSFESNTSGEPTVESEPTIAEGPGRVLPNSIAVLPFDNLSPNPDDAYFAAGLHEEVLSQLAKLRDLSVISRTSVLRYSDSDLSIPEIANELNVETVMEGSVRYADNRVRITTQLIDAETDEHLWSETYDREFADIFAIETDIATNIVTALEAEFSVSEQEHISTVPTVSPEAFSLYLRARNEIGFGGLGIGSSDSNVVTSTSYLDQAIELDPAFARAYALRAQTYWALIEYRRQRNSQSDELEERALEDLRRAIELDPKLGEAYMTLGMIHESNWRGKEAREAFEMALDLAPNNAIIAGLVAMHYSYIGEHDSAIRLGQRGVDLQPNLPTPHHILGNVYTYAGDDSAAYGAFQLAAAIGMTTSNVELSWLEYRRGNSQASLTHVRNYERIIFGSGFSGGRPASMAYATYAYGLAGASDDARRIFTHLQERSTEVFVDDEIWTIAFLGMRDADRALHHLELAAGKGVSLPHIQISIKKNRNRDPILEQPGFVAVRNSLGFK